MKKQLKAVQKFHEAFGHPVEKEYTAGTLDLGALRHALMCEENQEYLDGVCAGNIEEIADALGDQLYILCGTILAHGMQDIIEKVFDEIQRSNMSKLGVDGKPIYREDGKILKGPGYFKPDLKKILNK
jgi:predicted HAD superfamily Cof-like phosphohydrolase